MVRIFIYNIIVLEGFPLYVQLLRPFENNVVISHVKLKYFHLKYPYIRFIRKMACDIFARGGPNSIFCPGPTLVSVRAWLSTLYIYI